MTPRALVEGGLPGPGQDRFPEAARETGRNLGLTGTATILANEKTDDGGGAPVSKWIPVEDVRCRIDPVSTSTRNFKQLIAEQTKEETTHVAAFDAGTDIGTDNRIEVDGKTWIITSKLERTDPLIEMVGIRGV